MVAACALLGTNEAQGQTDFAATTLEPGDDVRVTQPSGLQLNGVVTGVSPTVLTVDRYPIQPEQELRVERSGDPLWNGFAIGFVTGSVLGASIGRRGCFHGSTAGCVAKPGLVFGAIGALIDRARVGRTTVFLGESPPSSMIVPLLSSDAKGLFVALYF